jgi:hypothetical protein
MRNPAALHHHHTGSKSTVAGHGISLAPATCSYVQFEKNSHLRVLLSPPVTTKYFLENGHELDFSVAHSTQSGVLPVLGCVN